MLALVTSMFLWSSWSVRACEMYQKLESHLDDFWNAVWFTAVTALTIGYGTLPTHKTFNVKCKRDVHDEAELRRFIIALRAHFSLITTSNKLINHQFSRLGIGAHIESSNPLSSFIFRVFHHSAPLCTAGDIVPVTHCGRAIAVITGESSCLSSGSCTALERSTFSTQNTRLYT